MRPRFCWSVMTCRARRPDEEGTEIEKRADETLAENKAARGAPMKRGLKYVVRITSSFPQSPRAAPR